jgi:predicted SnoaL-like aldol condensation-catalyzing enzyme
MRGYHDNVAGSARRQSTMTTTDDIARNKAVTRQLLEELWSGGDRTLADELFAPDFRHHNVPPGTPPGPAGQRAFLTLMRARMPQMRTSIDDLFAEGERVAVRWTRRFVGPDGVEAHAQGADILIVRDGRIVELWAYAPQA